MLQEFERSKAVDLLLEAEKTRKPIVQLSTTFPEIQIEDPTQFRQRSLREKYKTVPS